VLILLNNVYNLLLTPIYALQQKSTEEDGGMAMSIDDVMQEPLGDLDNNDDGMVFDNNEFLPAFTQTSTASTHDSSPIPLVAQLPTMEDDIFTVPKPHQATTHHATVTPPPAPLCVDGGPLAQKQQQLANILCPNVPAAEHIIPNQQAITNHSITVASQDASPIGDGHHQVQGPAGTNPEMGATEGKSVLQQKQPPAARQLYTHSIRATGAPMGSMVLLKQINRLEKDKKKQNAELRTQKRATQSLLSTVEQSNKEEELRCSKEARKISEKLSKKHKREEVCNVCRGVCACMHCNNVVCFLQLQ
jgi:hypothetical protein